MFRKNFDGDRALKPRIARAIDLAHASGTDRQDNLVRAEPGCWRKRHRTPLQNTASRSTVQATGGRCKLSGETPLTSHLRIDLGNSTAPPSAPAGAVHARVRATA